MIGINYLKHLKTSYKTWKYWKQTKLYLHRGFIPSQTYIKYPPECNFDGKKVLNLGCGKNTYKALNVCNTDCFDGNDVDIVIDLSTCLFKALPFKDNTFDLIIANHVMEHIPNWFDCFKELTRILKPGGKLEIWVPPVSSDSAFTYRDHINFIGLFSFAGTEGHSRAGTNLSAEEEYKSIGHANKVRLIEFKARPALKWWIFFAPDWWVNFCSNHLRNCVSEECYLFQKREEK